MFRRHIKTPVLKLFPTSVSTRNFSNGDTMLHSLIREGNLSHIKTWLAETDVEVAAEMSKVANHSDCIPYDVIGESSLDYEEKLEASALLYPLMRRNNIKKLSETISIDSIFASYYSENGALNRNLEIACEAANHTRSLLTESETHPQTNDYGFDAQLALRAKIKAIRREVDKIAGAKADSPSEDLFELRAQVAKQYGVGNCREFSCAAWSHIRNKYREIGNTIYCFDDHGFVILDRGQGSHPLQYKTWSKSAVVCDAWIGDAYPAGDIERKLRTHRYYSLNNYNYSSVLIPFNPTIHGLVPAIPEPTLIGGMSFFAKPKLAEELKFSAKSEHCQPQGDPISLHM